MENVCVPERFVIATKGDLVKAKERYETTLAWRQQLQLDSILTRKHPHFKTIKRNYLRYHYKRSLNNEPVLYLKLGAVNFKGLRAANITIDDLVGNFLAVTEYLWQVVDDRDDAKCIQVIDVAGLRLADFNGDSIDYVRKTSHILEQHYPERCAHIYVINVPSWFDLIWSVVNGFLDPVTKEKMTIVRGKQKLFDALCKRIAPENLPPEYQVQSVQSGDNPVLAEATEGASNLRPRSPEDQVLYDLMAFLNGDDDAPSTNPLLKAKEILKEAVAATTAKVVEVTSNDEMRSAAVVVAVQDSQPSIQ